MPAGDCQRCGAAEVRCKGLCARCYFAQRYERPEGRARPGGARGPVAAQGSWPARAACQKHGALPWTGPVATPSMRSVCSSCPVRVACLADALGDPETAGVRAGTTEAERARLRR